MIDDLFAPRRPGPATIEQLVSPPESPIPNPGAAEGSAHG